MCVYLCFYIFLFHFHANFVYTNSGVNPPSHLIDNLHPASPACASLSLAPIIIERLKSILKSFAACNTNMDENWDVYIMKPHTFQNEWMFNSKRPKICETLLGRAL